MNFVFVKSTTLRWIMLSITIIIALIIVSQLYWLKRVYTLEQQQFNSGVVKSIRGLFEDVKIADNPAFQVKQIVEVIDPNTYLVRLDSIPDKDSLYYHLSNEFEDFPMMIGISRKSFIGKILNDAPVDERLNGTLAANAIAVWNGANIVRVHNVKETIETLKVVEALKNQL